MTFAHRFAWVVHALAMVAVLGVALTGAISLVYVGVALAALVWSLVCELRGRLAPLPAGAATTLTLVALVVTVAPAVVGRTSPVDAIASFLLVLTALKALGPKQGRDWLQIVLLSFFQLVGASALTIEPVFALVFLSYLVLAPLALVLLHLHRRLVDTGHAHRLTDRDLVDGNLLRSVANVTVLVFFLTLVLFAVFPRAGAGYLGGLFGSGTGISGFSDQVELGDVSALKIDETVALRVTIDGVDRLPPSERYWRGAVLDRFDGRRWRREETRPIQLRRQGWAFFLLPWNRTGAGRALRLEVVLEPILTPTVFALGRVHSIEGPFAGIVSDALGNLHGAWDRSRRIRYQMVSTLAPPVEAPTAATRSRDAIPRRVRQLATEIVAGIPEPGARAEALADHLDRGFRYSLEPGDPGDGDPLERFLFETREGHCEYFASALALLHRAAGLPSRLVTGYHGGEWNEFGGYFVIRNRHAHTWVETWIDGGWRRYDPTPASAPHVGGFLGRLAELSDASRMRWYRYVINYDVEDQFQIAFALRDRSLDLRDTFRRLRESALGDRGGAGAGGWVTALALVAAGGGLVMALRRRRRSGAARAEPMRQESVAYVGMLQDLARRGHDKGIGETPDEFARRMRERLGSDEGPLVEEISSLYEAIRFGNGDAPEASPGHERLEALIAELRDAAR